MYSNEIISYDLSLNPSFTQITRMLNKAFDKFTNLEGAIFHSDQGWQYQHELYQKVLKDHGIIQSIENKMDAPYKI